MEEKTMLGFRAPMWLIWACLTSEYAVLLIWQVQGENDLWLILAYALLIYFMVCNYHGKQVRLRYEQMLSIWTKIFSSDLVMVFVHKAVYSKNDLSGLAGLFLVQVLSVGIIDCIFKVLWRSFHKSDSGVNCGRNLAADAQELLCIYSGHVPESELLAEYKMVCVSAASNLEEAFQEIRKSKSVFLYDIPAELRGDLIKCAITCDKPLQYTAKLTDIQTRASGLSELGDKPVFFCERYGIGRGAERRKRFFDIIFSFLMLCILSPLFGVIAIAIKLEDGGSIFYRQIRCTKDMRKFSILKFRSMIPEAEEELGARLADTKDKRLTKTGYVLRKFKLDELPQLVNILKGDMSFVGPRPERPELIEETLKRVPEFTLRTKVPAGLTGYAQVHGDYHTDFLDKLKWDLMYIENYSLLLDFKIILMTIPAVLKGSGDV